MGVCVKVTGHSVQQHPDGKGGPFAAYSIVVSEGNERWELTRRWNDLKLMMEALTKVHSAELHKIPKFEPHSWRIGHANLDSLFLDHRMKAMNEILQALVDTFNISMRLRNGPEPLCSFLARDGRPGVLSSLCLPPQSLSEALDEASSPSEAGSSTKTEPLCSVPEHNSLCEKFSETAVQNGIPVEEPPDFQFSEHAHASPPVATQKLAQRHAFLWQATLLLPVFAILAKLLFASFVVGNAALVEVVEVESMS